MKHCIFIFILLFALSTKAQEEKRKFRPLLWTQHELNTDIAGVSLGFFPENHKSDDYLNRTFGVRLEAYPLSFFNFLAPSIPKFYSVTHKIYGINISSGTFESINVYGLNITMFLNNIDKMNGISISGVSNSIENANGVIVGFGGNGIEKGNGILIGGIHGNYAIDFKGMQVSFENDSTNFTGLQVGLWNKAKTLKGIQIGLWNKNQKRSFPIINWSF